MSAADAPNISHKLQSSRKLNEIYKKQLEHLCNLNHYLLSEISDKMHIVSILKSLYESGTFPINPMRTQPRKQSDSESDSDELNRRTTAIIKFMIDPASEVGQLGSKLWRKYGITPEDNICDEEREEECKNDDIYVDDEEMQPLWLQYACDELKLDGLNESEALLLCEKQNDLLRECVKLNSKKIRKLISGKETEIESLFLQFGNAVRFPPEIDNHFVRNEIRETAQRLLLKYYEWRLFQRIHTED